MNRTTPRESVNHFLILDDNVEHEYPEALVRGMIDITEAPFAACSAMSL